MFSAFSFYRLTVTLVFYLCVLIGYLEEERQVSVVKGVI